MGSNNYIAENDKPEKTAAGVVLGIKKSLNHLVAKGAKHILVFNLPDMGKSPAARAISLEKELDLCSRTHNIALEKSIEELQIKNSDVEFILFDAASGYEKALANPSKYGFTNTTDTCYQSLLSVPSAKFILNMASTLVEPNKSNDACDGYFFFDPIHPTTLTHQVLADQLKATLEKANIRFG